MHKNIHDDEADDYHTTATITLTINELNSQPSNRTHDGNGISQSQATEYICHGRRMCVLTFIYVNRTARICRAKKDELERQTSEMERKSDGDRREKKKVTENEKKHSKRKIFVTFRNSLATQHSMRM